jgi:hypothetical protein
MAVRVTAICAVVRAVPPAAFVDPRDECEDEVWDGLCPTRPDRGGSNRGYAERRTLRGMSR